MSENVSTINPENPIRLSGIEGLTLCDGDKLPDKLLERMISPEVRELIKKVIDKGGKIGLKGSTLTMALLGSARLNQQGISFDPEGHADYDLVLYDQETCNMFLELAPDYTSSNLINRLKLGGVQVDVINVPEVQKMYKSAIVDMKNWYKGLDPDAKEALEKKHFKVLEASWGAYNPLDMKMMLTRYEDLIRRRGEIVKGEHTFFQKMESRYLDESTARWDRFSSVTSEPYVHTINRFEALVDEGDPQKILALSNFMAHETLNVTFSKAQNDLGLEAKIHDIGSVLLDPVVKIPFLVQLPNDYFGLSYLKPNVFSVQALFLEALPMMDDTVVNANLMKYTLALYPRLLRTAFEQNIDFTEPADMELYFSTCLYPAAEAIRDRYFADRENPTYNEFVERYQLAFARSCLSSMEGSYFRTLFEYPFGFVFSNRIDALVKDTHDGRHRGNGIQIAGRFIDQETRDYMRESGYEFGTPEVDVRMRELCNKYGFDKKQFWQGIYFNHLVGTLYGTKAIDMEQGELAASPYFPEYAVLPTGMSEIVAVMLVSLGLDPNLASDASIIEDVAKNWRLKGTLKNAWRRQKGEFDLSMTAEKTKEYMREIISKYRIPFVCKYVNERILQEDDI